MDISLYIAELLEEHEYVIIPGLGALISNYQPARFDQDGKTLLPPSRLVSFNPEMKINDGLLAGYLAHQQKIPLSQAQKILNRYIGDLIYQLDHDGKTVFDRLGNLIVKEGVYQFVPDASFNKNPGSFGLDPVEALIAEPKKDQPPVKIQEKPGKSGKRLWMGIVSFSLIAILLLSLYFIFSSKPTNTSLPQTVHQTDTTSRQQAETKLSQEPDSSGQTQKIPAETRIAPPDSAKELYYVIGGSFKSQQFANEYFDKMTTRGFHPIRLGNIGNFWMIALEAYPREQEAVQAANRITGSHPGTDLWIFHRKK